MTPEEAVLFEEALSAHRAVHRGRVRPSPAWFDIPQEERERLFRETEQLRAVEAALDPDGLDTTARSVMALLTKA
jgi:hypothetical protein